MLAQPQLNINKTLTQPDLLDHVCVILWDDPLTEVRAFQRKSLTFFKENLSNTKQKSLKRFWRYYDESEYQN